MYVPRAGEVGLGQSHLEPVRASECNEFLPPVPPAMPPSPAGLVPLEGIPMVAQAVLHRGILHVHALLELISGMLRSRLAITSAPFLEQVTNPHSRLCHPPIDAGHPYRPPLHS